LKYGQHVAYWAILDGTAGAALPPPVTPVAKPVPLISTGYRCGEELTRTQTERSAHNLTGSQLKRPGKSQQSSKCHFHVERSSMSLVAELT
jgi:hypothetical protein